MARDYKHRADIPKPDRTRKKAPAKAKATNARQKPRASAAPRKSSVKPRAKSQPAIPLWRWLAVIGLLGLFGYFLYSLSNAEQEPAEQPTTATKPLVKPKPKVIPKKQVSKPLVSKPVAVVKPVKPVKPKQNIKYDFYTVLPEKEFVLPDYEIKTRKREERIGKEKKGVQYSVQAGAFRNLKDADSLKAKLLLMGFLPKIEKAHIKAVTWYRVKMGPYTRMVSVDAIMSRLTKNGMDALVIEGQK